jgi:hypothetical protein
MLSFAVLSSMHRCILQTNLKHLLINLSNAAPWNYGYGKWSALKPFSSVAFLWQPLIAIWSYLFSILGFVTRVGSIVMASGR